MSLLSGRNRVEKIDPDPTIESAVEEEQARKVAAKIQKGQFDLEDMIDQLRQLKKMGGLGSVMSMLPGIGKVQKQMAQHSIDDKMIGRQEAIILSMTPGERAQPDIIGRSRATRIARGCGRRSKDVRGLVGRFDQMREMMGQLGAGGMLGRIPGLGRLAGNGGLSGLDPAALMDPGAGGRRRHRHHHRQG